MGTPKNVHRSVYINGWAHIARHLGFAIRTVERYVRSRNMPVYFPTKIGKFKTQGTPFAHPVELTAWFTNTEPAVPQESLPSVKLTGWCEIADFLRVSVKTARRWETCFGLPVSRTTEFSDTPRKLKVGNELVFGQSLTSWNIGFVLMEKSTAIQPRNGYFEGPYKRQ